MKDNELLFDRKSHVLYWWLLGGTYERMGNPGNGRPETLHYSQG